MARLNAKARARIPSSQFGLPAERKYPVEDRAHAADAKSRASAQEAKGNITPGQERQIDAKADRVLGEHDGARRSFHHGATSHKPGA